VIEVELLHPPQDEVIAVRTNFERRTGEDHTAALTAARAFATDRIAAHEMAKALFGLEVKP
jgi:hypothetical protein